MYSQEDLESCPDVMKWETMSNESKRTPDMDPVDLDKYQVGVTRFPPIFLSRLTNTIRVPENLCLTPVSLFYPHFVSVPASTFTHTYTQQLHNTKHAH